MEEDIRKVKDASDEGPNVELGAGGDGYTLYVERQGDGSGVAIDIDRETYEGIEKTFILSDDR